MQKDDVIYRQAAIDALMPIYKSASLRNRNVFSTARKCMAAIEDLPSAQPEPQEGHWIKHESLDGGEQYECSLCGVLWEFNDGTPEDNEAYYCPKCGADLRGEQDG